MATPPTAGQVSTIYVESAMSAVTSDLYTLFITLENVEIKHFFPLLTFSVFLLPGREDGLRVRNLLTKYFVNILR